MSFAKLYFTSHPDTPHQVVYIDRTRVEKSGRARRVVKWFKLRAEAEAYLADINRRIGVQGTAGLHFDASARADWEAARKALDAAGWRIPLHEAVREFLRERPNRAAAGRPLAELIEAFLESKRYGEARREETVSDLEKRLTKWRVVASLVTLGDVGREAVLALRNRRGVGVRTRRNDLSAVFGFCQWLVEEGWLANNPAAEVKRPAAERQASPTIWAVAEARAVMEAAVAYREGCFVPWVVLAVFAGLRPSEIPQAGVFLEGEACVRVEGGKLRGRANRIVPLGENAVAWLRRFPVGKDGKLQRLTNRARQAIRDAAGVAWMADTPRHTFISNRLAVIKDEGSVAREAGNSPDIIFRHYHRLVSEVEARAFWGIGPSRE